MTAQSLGPATMQRPSRSGPRDAYEATRASSSALSSGFWLRVVRRLVMAARLTARLLEADAASGPAAVLRRLDAGGFTIVAKTIDVSARVCPQTIENEPSIQALSI